VAGTLITKLEFGEQSQYLFKVVVYDLLSEPVDCIVNAANGGLSHGGGLALEIDRAAGPEFTEECDRLVETHGRIPVGGAGVTGAGKLPFKGIIHAVGPRMGDRVPHPVCARGYLRAVREFFEGDAPESLTTIHLCLLTGPVLEAVKREFTRP
jgi:O-acetyl-ADP-ribose deacetylase (regulator of RNase III)